MDGEPKSRKRAAEGAVAAAAATAAPKREAVEGGGLDLPLDALLLLANLAGQPGSARKPEAGGNTRARPATAAAGPSSSGGSADTQSKLPGGSADSAGARGGGCVKRAAAQKRRRITKEDEESEDEDEMLREMEAEAGSDSELDEGEERGGDAGSDTEAAGGEGAAAAAAPAAASPSVPASQDAEPGAKPKKERPPKKDKPPVPLGPRKYVSSQITISILEQEGCFNMTQVDAARHLGFGSSTVLKKVMRRLGIKQWPYRKRTSAKKITHSLEEYMRKYGDPAKVDAVLERVRMELAVYEASPTGSIPLRPELAALRQRLYKLDNKVKHDFKRDAEGPLRQCVQSLVDKTWQELQPSWMSDLAQQPAAEGGSLPAVPALAAGGSGGSGGEGGGAFAGVDAATLWALFVSQGLLVPGLGGGEGGSGGGGGGEGEGSADQDGGSQEDGEEQQEQKPEMTAEEKALARVAALAPEPVPAGKKEKKGDKAEKAKA